MALQDATAWGIVVAQETDIHAFAVRHAGSELGLQIRIIDTATYLTEFFIDTFLSGASQRTVVCFKTGETIESRDIKGIWWRRPAQPRPQNTIQPGLLPSIANELSHALFGSWSATVRNNFNDPAASRRAFHKPLQLRKATEYGFRIPDTLITSHPDEAHHFYKKLGGKVIYKLFDGSDVGLFETRPLQPENLNELWRLTRCPIIFQERIDGDFDLRITVVGEKAFCSRIDFDKSSEMIDSRFTMASTTAFSLPLEIETPIIRLVRDFGLKYAAIDMRFNEKDGFTFFELNPEGQYLWTEIEAELPISAAIAQQLFDR